jgi:hypothetical protein
MRVSASSRNGSSFPMRRYRSGHTAVLRMPELTISPEKVGYLIEKAREFDVKEIDTDPVPVRTPSMTMRSTCWRTTAAMP